MFSDQLARWTGAHAEEREFLAVWKHIKDSKILAELAASAKLPPALRTEAATHTEPSVRKAFASRGDLTAGEVSHFIEKERRADVLARVMSRELAPETLEDIAARGKAVILDAMIRNCAEVKLARSPEALKAAIIRATTCPGSTHSGSYAFWAAVAADSSGAVLAVDTVTSVEAATAVLSNPRVWSNPKAVLACVQYLTSVPMYGQGRILDLIATQISQSAYPVKLPNEVTEALKQHAETTPGNALKVQHILNLLDQASGDLIEVTLENVHEVLDRSARSAAVVMLWEKGASYRELSDKLGQNLPLDSMLQMVPQRAVDLIDGASAEGVSQYSWDSLLSQCLNGRAVLGEEVLRHLLPRVPHGANGYTFNQLLSAEFENLEEETRKAIPAWVAVGRNAYSWMPSPVVGWLVSKAVTSTADTEQYLTLLDAMVDSWTGNIGELADSIEALLQTTHEEAHASTT